jgi:5-deoxy-glucuronate isomerase
MQRDDQWFHRRGELADGPWETVVDASLPGWEHTGLRVGTLEVGVPVTLDAAGVERMVIPLAGSVTVAWSHDGDSGSFDLAGRSSVFAGPTDVAYLGIDTRVELTGSGRIAVAEAPATVSLPAAKIERTDVPVELRGAGRSTRQVHNFGVPGGLDASKLLVCEVITPADNWSSFPAHKHDEEVPGVESKLEEIYYFESEVTRGAASPASADPVGVFATYSSPAGEIDINALVRTGDVALVPFGYHGPAGATPGYDLYYLNVMAGPSPDRVWQISDDPGQTWVRDTWQGQDTDPRLPYLSHPEGTAS